MPGAKKKRPRRPTRTLTPRAGRTRPDPALHQLPAGHVQKARHPLITPLLLLAGAAAIVGGFWLVSSSGVIANRFKPQIETELTKALNRPVAVGRLEGGIFDRVVLRDVRIGAPASDPLSFEITIDRVVVRYSLWDILVRKIPLSDSLREIQFIRPLLRFEKDSDGTWRGPNLMSWSAPAAGQPLRVPNIRLTMYGGELRFSAGAQQASLHNLRGQLNLADPHAAKLYLSGRTEEHRGQNLKVSGELDLPAGKVRLALRADQMRLRPYERVVQPSPYLEVLSGAANVEVQFVSRRAADGDLIPGVEVTGKMVLADVALKTSLLSQPLRGLYGVTLLHNDRIQIKNVQAALGRTAWVGSGTIDHLAKPRVLVRVQNPNLRLEDLIAASPTFAGLNTRGTGSATFLLKGEAPDLTATATLRLVHGQVGKVAIENFESITRFAGSELRLLLARGAVAHGWVEGQGRIVFPDQPGRSPAISFHGTAKGLSVSDLASLVKFQTLSGTVDGDLEIGGTLDQPTLLTSLRSERIQAAGWTFRRFAGTLDLRPDQIKLSAQAQWGDLSGVRLDGTLLRRGEAWLLPHAGVYYGGQEILGVAGEFGTGPPEPILAQVRARRFPLRVLPFLPSALGHLNGTLDFDGRIGGTRREPVLAGRLQSSEFLRVGARPVDASGTVWWGGDQLAVSDFTYDHGRTQVNGALTFLSVPMVRVQTRFSAAPLAGLAALVGWPKASPAPAGTVSGQADLSGPLAKLLWRGELGFRDLAWSGLKADTGSVNFLADANRILVPTLELRQPAGRFQASLDWVRGAGAGPLKVHALWERFVIGGRTWNGVLNVAGTNPAQGVNREAALRLDLGHFSVDGHALPAAVGQLTYNWNDQRLRVSRVDWGEALALTGGLDFGPAWSGDLQLALTRTHLGPLREILSPRREPLADPVSGTVAMHVTAAQATGVSDLTIGTGKLHAELTWRAAGPEAPAALGVSFKAARVPLNTALDMLLVSTPEHLPLGLASGDLRFASGADGLTGLTGEFDVQDFQFGEWHFKQLNTLWDQQGDRLLLKSLVGTQPDGTLKVQGSAQLKGPDGVIGLSADLVADHFKFISRYFGGHFQVRGGLRLAETQDLRLQVRSPDLQINLCPFGTFAANLRYQGQSLTLDTPTDLPYRIQGDLQLPPDGSVEFKHLEIADARQRFVSATGRIGGSRTPTDLKVEVNNVAADTIARSLNWPQPWTGTASGTIHYLDPGNAPAFRIDVKIENGSVLHLPFDSFAGTLVLDHDWLYFQGPRGACVLSRAGKYTMNMAGKLPLPQSTDAETAMRGSELDLHVTMPEGDLSYITFIPYFSAASGKSSLDLNVRGTMDYPSLYGSATVDDGSLSPRLYTPLVEHITARLRFDNNEVFIDKLEGRMGEGWLEVTAGPRAPWAVIFRRLEPDDLNLALRSKNGRLWLDTTPDLEFASAWLTLQASLSGTMENPVLGGTLELADGQFIYPDRPLSAFARGLKGGNFSYQNLQLIARKNLWYTNDMLRAQIKPDNSVTFDGGRNDLSGKGRVAVAMGTFTYLDQDFTLDPDEETAVTFQAQQPPRLSALAQTVIRDVQIKDQGRMREVTIYLRASGTLGALHMDLSSDPVLSQSQIMSVLTLGEDFSSMSKEELDQEMQSAGARILGKWAGNLLGHEVERRIKKIAPVDQIGIHFGGMEQLGTVMTGANTATSVSQSLLQNTQISVGKYLTNELYFNYQGTVKDRSTAGGGLSWESLLGMEYNLGASRRLRVYKNFDPDSQQEFYWGIEARNEFQGWSPTEGEGNTQAAAGQKKTGSPQATP